MSDFDSFYIVSLIFPFVLILLLYRIRKKKSKKNKVLYWNVVAIAFVVSSIFLIGETYYRFFVDTTDSFAVNKISRRWLKRHSKLNNRNFRDDLDYFTQIEKGMRRVSIIGDSFTDGHGVKNIDDRYPNLLREKFPGNELHIIAHPGANSSSELDNLYRLKAHNYEFDIVILAYCLNDIDYFVKGTTGIYKRIHDFSNNLSYLARESYFINMMAFRFFAYRDPDFKNYSDFVLEGYSNEAWKDQKKVLKEIIEFVNESGTRFLVVTFPFLQQEKEEYAFREAHQVLGKFWESEGIPHLDLLNVYEPYLGKNLTVNQYDAHPNEFAHQLAADAIYDFFKNLKAK